MEAFLEGFRTELDIGTIALRMGIAALLGVVLGLDREYRRRPAGLRTYMLVALAASTFTIVAFELSEAAIREGFASVDPSRVIEAVTAGVAFLAAGSIIQARGAVHGITTGAGLWLAGAIGAACGIGVYSVALLATGFGVVILALLGTIEKQVPKEAPKPGEGNKGRQENSPGE
jgi:putative Mg2+ transporter-C (MgtC) family protein